MADEQSELQACLVSELLQSIYYLPNFITADEEKFILSAIDDLPASKWTVLSHRRLLSLPSQLTGNRKDTLLQAPMPQYLRDPVLHRFQALKIFQNSPHLEPNHCLVNEYHPGQGIMPHEDGPAYYPVTATVSLGSHTVLDIYRKNTSGEKENLPTWRILQEPRSLLVTTGNAYKETLHSIQGIDCDENLSQGEIANWELLGDASLYQRGQATRATRVSLTYRDVLKVSNLGGALKFMTKK